MAERKSEKILYFLLIVSFLVFPQKIYSADVVPRSQYLSYARASADWTWSRYDQLIEKWKQGFDPENVFGYRPPGGLLEMAVIYSYLFEKEKKA